MKPTKPDRYWWTDRVAYQIYPRSFRDANGDGTGDLKGITEKLDYLRDLGIGLLWLSPVYRSPMDDGGYDISDYRDIDPIFGSMADLDELLREANRRDIRVLMDLVVNHCSDEHPLFQKALREPGCEEEDFFYFRRTSDGNPPNNWRSMFGGSAWEKTPDGRWYLHLFSRKQPDLNWENPKLREKLYDMIRFWLDKGLGGFRIDAIVHLKKQPGLPSGPRNEPDGMVDCFPYARNIPGIGDFLTELREQTFDRYQCVTVAEAAGVPNEQLADYIGPNGYFSTMFDFSYAEPYSCGPGWHTCKNPGEWSFRRWRDTLYASQLETQKVGYGAVFLENHDYPRAIQKFVPEKDHAPEVQKMLGILYFFLRGIPFLYQGQELGMTNPGFTSIDQIRDLSTKNHYRLALADGLKPAEAMRLVARYARDNARVPFPWDDSENGGFSPAGSAKPWMMVHPDYRTVNAAAELADPDSVLAFYRKMIALRKADRLFVDGTFAPILRRYDKLIAYTRTNADGRRAAVVCSLSDRARTVVLPFAAGKTLLASHGGVTVSGGTLALKPYQGVVLEVS